ncbi:MAG: hypothetical protein KY456_05025, partial [Chloroflexi bacterium]|nr:hypothetical protein [Chloroflexota bacterium]
MLGTASPVAGSFIDRVSDIPSHESTTWVEVASLDFHQPDAENVVAFAIDQPRSGERSAGAGFEINGWVIGRHLPVRGVRTISRDKVGPLYPLDVRRPDVAADYPDHPHAGSSGFSGWAPVDPKQGDWQIGLEAVLANGCAVALAVFRGRTDVEARL